MTFLCQKRIQKRLVYLQVTLQIVRDITFGYLPRKMGDEPAIFGDLKPENLRKSRYYHLVLLIYSYENKFMAFHGPPNGLHLDQGAKSPLLMGGFAELRWSSVLIFTWWCLQPARPTTAVKMGGIIGDYMNL